jgi:hypothetical protein
MRSLPVVAIAACGGGAAAPAKIPAGVARAEAPVPVVRLSVDPSDKQHEHLPALTLDGEQLAWVRMSSGGGPPDVHLVVRDTDGDEITRELVLVRAEEQEWDQDGQSTLDPKVLAAREREANAWFSARRWARLDAFTMAPDEADDAPWDIARSASLGDLVVEYDEPKLVIRRGGRVVVDRQVPEWSAPRQRSDALCDDPTPVDPSCTCSNPAFLTGVQADSARTVLVVWLDFYGTDSCWEPPSEPHLVVLP